MRYYWCILGDHWFIIREHLRQRDMTSLSRDLRWMHRFHRIMHKAGVK